MGITVVVLCLTAIGAIVMLAWLLWSRSTITVLARCLHDLPCKLAVLISLSKPSRDIAEASGYRLLS